MADTIYGLSTDNETVLYGSTTVTPMPGATVVGTGSSNWSSGQLALSSDGTQLAIPDTGLGQVYVYDVATNALTHTITNADITNIYSCAWSPDDSILYVLSYGNGIVDPFLIAYSTGGYSVLWSMDLSGFQPISIMLSPDGSTAYVVDQTANQLLFIDLSSQTVTDTVAGLGSVPRWSVVTPDNSTVYVMNVGSNDVSVVDTGLATVLTTIALGGMNPVSILISADGDTVWVVDSTDITNSFGAIDVIDATTNTLTSTQTYPTYIFGFNSGGLSSDGTVMAVSGATLLNAQYAIIDPSTMVDIFDIVIPGGNLGASTVVIPPSTPLIYQADSGFGAGQAQPGTTNLYVATSAFGAGYAQPVASAASPIPPTADGYAFLLRNRSARASAQISVPVAPPPPAGTPGPGEPTPIPGKPGDAIAAALALAPLGIPRVSEILPKPIIIGGQPYLDSNRTPWKASKVIREVWCTQLQIEVGGEDVTFFRGTPTIVGSWASQEPFGDSSCVFVLPAVTSFDQLIQPVAIPTGEVVGIAGTFTGAGYWQVAESGLVVGYGDASFFGDGLGLINAPISGIAASPSAYGYALVAEDGGVFCYGETQFRGSLPGLGLTPPSPVVGIALTASGNGYWLVDQGGQIYAFGDAVYYGNAPLVSGDVAVGIARAPAGNGYYVLCSNGNLYALPESTPYHGNGSSSFVAPYTGIATSPGVDGYVFVNSLGQAYAFGAVLFEGDVGEPINEPTNSIALVGNSGYWMSAGDGGVFAFGSVPFLGSVPGGGTTDAGSLSWLTLGAPMTINRVGPDGSVKTLFEGVVADWEDAIADDQVGLSIQCVGSLFQLDWYIAKPIPNLPFQGYSPDTGNPIFGWDIAQAVPQAISSVYNPTPGTAIGTGAVPSPRPSPFNGNACVLNIPGGGSETGILTVTQPAWDKLLTSYIQNILSQAETFGGAQYTVGLQRPRTPVLMVKDFDSVNWTVATGGSGVKQDLSLDITTAANAIYGSGTAPPVISTIQAGNSVTTTGLAGTWAGAKFPRIAPATPPFPLSPGAVFTPGGAAGGLGPFSDWMRQSGWPMVSGNTYVATNGVLGNLDYYLILNWQVQAGLEPTGNIDEATWNAAFITGTNAGAIANTYYSPLWELAEVEPFTYSPSGAFVGQNPFYNPNVPRVERYEAMGSQVSKAQGVLSATVEGGHIEAPTWTGTITLTADPQEGSRFEILAGQNILLQFFHGRDVLFHISNVSVDFTNLSVQLTVSAQALDLVTLAAIYARDTQAHGVSRQARPSLVNLNISSNTTTFDSESSAGLVPPNFVGAGSWTVLRMGASQSGQIAETSLVASPATPFAIGVFSGPVAPSDLAAIFGPGGPLLADALGNNPWNDFAVALDALGLLYGAGGPDGACGFYPSDPSGTQTLTGQYVDGQTWPYCSAPGYSPWLWVAFWAQDDCFITGRFLPAPASGQ